MYNIDELIGLPTAGDKDLIIAQLRQALVAKSLALDTALNRNKELETQVDELEKQLGDIELREQQLKEQQEALKERERQWNHASNVALSSELERCKIELRRLKMELEPFKTDAEVERKRLVERMKEHWLEKLQKLSNNDLDVFLLYQIVMKKNLKWNVNQRLSSEEISNLMQAAYDKGAEDTLTTHNYLQDEEKKRVLDAIRDIRYQQICISRSEMQNKLNMATTLMKRVQLIDELMKDNDIVLSDLIEDWNIESYEQKDCPWDACRKGIPMYKMKQANLKYLLKEMYLRGLAS